MSDDVNSFRARTAMPPGDVDLLEARDVGFLDTLIVGVRAEVYAQLRKRYDVTFPSGVPDIVWRWIARIATPEAYDRRGGNPSDQTLQALRDGAQMARDQIKEAADSVTGLYDLPLLNTSSASAITRGGPRAYAEQSPYSAKRRQVDAGREEDRNGR